MAAVILSPVEARVVTALVEKSLTTPQYYPMSANALVQASNQKNCRHPVMSLGEGEVQNALNRLEELKFVSRDAFSARVTKWRHAFQHQLMLDSAQMAVLATLVLRGPQTVAELRANAQPLKGPADDAGVSAVLKDLMERATPLAVQLPRAAGQAATRYAHTISGDPPVESAGAEPAMPRADRIEQLEARVAALEAQLEELRQRIP